jgi:4-amino-4-deoxy-L-arabinose transferase-like glycosyltransferase
MLARDRTAQLVLLAAVVVRVGLLATAGNADIRVQDEHDYYNLAIGLFNGSSFTLNGHLTSMRPPLYPVFVAAVWSAVGGPSLFAVRAVQAVLGLLTCILVYQLALRLFNRRVALLALTGLAFYPSFLFASVLLLTEVLFTVLVIIAVVGYVSLISEPRRWVALLTGCAVGLAALTRSVLWPFPLLLVPLTVWAVPGRFRTKAAAGSLLLLGYMMVVGPWAVRNTRLQGTLTIVDTMGGMNLRMGNYKDTPDDRMWDAVALSGTNNEKNWSADLLREHPDAATWTDGQKDKWAQRKAVEYIWQHPWISLRRAGIKFADFWGLEREFAAGIQRGVYRVPTWVAVLAIASIGVSYPVLMLLAILGVFTAGPRDVRAHFFLLLVVIFICGIHTVVFGHSRYHLPLVPILVMYAASAVSQFQFQRVKLSTAGVVPALVTMLVLVTIWTREVFIVDAARIRALLQGLG